MTEAPRSPPSLLAPSQTGLAASVDLRCFSLLTPSPPLTSSSAPAHITLSIPDLSSTQTWAASTLPWDLAPAWTGTPPDALDQVLLGRCEELAESGGGDARGRVSAAAFLYLLVVLSKGVPSCVPRPLALPSRLRVPRLTPRFAPRRTGFEFVARSSLPMGAGLGSSAAYSTCLATTFLLHFKHVAPPALPQPSSETHTHISHRGRRAIGPDMIDVVDQWAFLAEKVIHGNPSGIDNAVSVRGGAVAFRRKVEGVQQGGMEGIKSCVPVFRLRRLDIGRRRCADRRDPPARRPGSPRSGSSSPTRASGATPRRSSRASTRASSPSPTSSSRSWRRSRPSPTRPSGALRTSRCRGKI